MRHITSCSGQARRLLSDDGPAAPTRPRSKKRTRREPNGRARPPPQMPHSQSHSIYASRRRMLLSPSCAQLTISWNATRVTGPRRMECLTVVLPHHCPCGQATTAYSLRSGHEVCRIGTSPAAYFLSPSSMLRRQSRQSRQSPIIHARRASNGHGQPPPPAPVQLCKVRRQTRRGVPTPPLERDYEYARLHARFRQLGFTLGFVSSRSVSSARAHARPTAASLTRPSHDSSHSAPSAVTRPSHYSSHRYGWHRLQRRAYSPQPARPQS